MASSAVGRMGWWLTTVLPPTATTVAFKDLVLRHPWWTLGAVLFYEILVALILILSKVLAKLQQRWIDRLTEAVDSLTQRTFSRYRRRYLNYLKAIHYDVDLKGLETQSAYALGVEQVFVDLSLDSEPLHRISNDLLAEGQQARHRAVIFGREFTGSGSDALPSRFTIWEFLRDTESGPSRLAIIGAPGTGKTTLLKHVLLTLVADRRGNPSRGTPIKGKLPVLIFLREHAEAIAREPSLDLTDVIRRSLASLPGREPPGWFESQLKRGRCLMMFDGLDEVSTRDQRRVVAHWADEQIAKYPRNRYVLSSRPHGYEGASIASATVLRVQRFTEMQIEQFLSRWYLATYMRRTGRDDIGVREHARRDATDLYRRIIANLSLSRLAVNPLLLTMTAHVHFYRGVLPGRRVDLYREICQVVLGKRQEAKGVSENLTSYQKEMVLRSLAFEMMNRGVRDIEISEAASIVSYPLRSTGSTVTPEEFIDLIEQSSGLLLAGDPGVYYFAHLTFQEYLCSAHVLENAKVEKLVECVSDEWWRETIVLYAAQTDASPLVSACLASSDPDGYQLVLAMDCINQARNVKPKLREQVLAAVMEDPLSMSDDRRNAIAGAILRQGFQEARHLRGDVYLRQRPITNHEYSFFVADQRSMGQAREPDHWVGGHFPDVEGADSPAGGMRGEDVAAFSEWLSSVIGDNWVYSLPHFPPGPNNDRSASIEEFSAALGRTVPGIWGVAAENAAPASGEDFGIWLAIMESRAASNDPFAEFACNATTLEEEKYIESILSARLKDDLRDLDSIIRGRQLKADRANSDLWSELLASLSDESYDIMALLLGSWESVNGWPNEFRIEEVVSTSNCVDIGLVLREAQAMQQEIFRYLSEEGDLKSIAREMSQLSQVWSTSAAFAFSRQRPLGRRGSDIAELRTICRLASLLIFCRLRTTDFVASSVAGGPHKSAKFIERVFSLGRVRHFWSKKTISEEGRDARLATRLPFDEIASAHGDILSRLLILEQRISGKLPPSEEIHIIRT